MIQLEEYIVLTLQVLISNVVTAFINAATDRPMKNSDRHIQTLKVPKKVSRLST